MEYYTLEVAGLKRELPLCAVDEHMDIAAFIMFSDVELTVACAKELLEKAPEFDVMITAESKGIPLAYEMARQSGKNYVVARKSIVAKVNIKKGEILTEENLTTKRPGNGVSPMKWNEIIGTVAIRDFAEDELIKL